MRRLKTLLLAAFALFGSTNFSCVRAQVAVKSNLLYDASTTPNVGMEVGLSRKTTAQVFYGLNPWRFDSDSHGQRMAKHWVVMPEVRWWPCTKFNGHFIGVHGMGGQFNAANVDLPVPGRFFKGDNLTRELRSHSYEGHFLGAGFTYGYQWILSRHWNLEGEIGVGYNRVWYDKYECGECGPKLSSGKTNYAGLTKLGITLLYVF